MVCYPYAKVPFVSKLKDSCKPLRKMSVLELMGRRTMVGNCFFFPPIHCLMSLIFHGIYATSPFLTAITNNKKAIREELN